MTEEIGAEDADDPALSADDQPATVEGSATIDFEASDLSGPLRSADEWLAGISEYAVGLSVADRLLRRDKSEMVSFVEGIVSETGRIEPISELLDLVRDTREAMEFLTGLAQTTEARLYIAASSVAVSPDEKEA